MSEIYRYPPEQEVREKRLSFEELDVIPYVDENGNTLDHKNLERWEQLIAKQYILPTDAVLEMGGRFGTVSCVINNILDNPFSHVVIEPEEAILPSLLRNRAAHNSFFTVYRNIICNKKKKLICAGHSTRAVDCSGDDDETTPSMTLADVAKHHGYGFTALVADCEGCMEEFVASNLDFVRGLRLVTYEQDFPELSNYANVINMLKDCGFQCVVNGFHMVWVKP